MDDDEATGFRWETAYEKTWEALSEDHTGSLKTSVQNLLHQSKRRRLLDRPKNVRLGIMRHLYIVVDMSDAMKDKDLFPSRQAYTISLIDSFLDDFFDKNPISQIGLIATKDKRAEKISELTGNARRHKEALKKLRTAACLGEPSLQNSLEMALKTLSLLPSHTSREVLIIMGSLSSCDPTNIATTIATLKKHRIRCSAIGLAAEVHICKQLCEETKGTYTVILDETHFKDTLNGFTLPPVAEKDAECNMVRMGFPVHKMTDAKEPSTCICHVTDNASTSSSNAGGSTGLSEGGYFCPQCGSKYCNVPIECRVCGLTLVSAPQLARSYQHLFPLEAFQEQQINDSDNRRCYACETRLETRAYACPQCAVVVCVDCDLLLHESLQLCPGCCCGLASTS